MLLPLLAGLLRLATAQTVQVTIGVLTDNTGCPSGCSTASTVVGAQVAASAVGGAIVVGGAVAASMLGCSVQ